MNEISRFLSAEFVIEIVSFYLKFENKGIYRMTKISLVFRTLHILWKHWMLNIVLISTGRWTVLLLQFEWLLVIFPPQNVLNSLVLLNLSRWSTFSDFIVYILVFSLCFTLLVFSFKFKADGKLCSWWSDVLRCTTLVQVNTCLI